jgi:hypothetical protein
VNAVLLLKTHRFCLCFWRKCFDYQHVFDENA